MTLVCEKYEGLGNDFLVTIDPDRALDITTGLVTGLCDRHLGVGADGLIRLSRATGGAVAMDLRNADGSFAETSGNGLRCAAFAALRSGLTDALTFDIITSSGVSHVDFASPPVGGEATIRVTMGTLAINEVPTPIGGYQAFQVDVGNPHLVLFGKSFDGIDLPVDGPRLEALEQDGQNVEVIVSDGTDVLDLRVWERGAGITEACGTGSCAAGGVAWLLGECGPRIVVNNPGGPLVVELSGADRHAPQAALTGPTRRIACIEIDADSLLQSPVPLGGRT